MIKTWITVIRHGETEWNAAMRLQGIRDSELTPKGLKQIESAALVLRDRKFEVFLSSDLGRTIKTAESINAFHGLEIQKNRALRERNFGKMEGMTLEQIKKNYADAYKGYSLRKESYQVPGGESLIEFNRRVMKGIDDIISKYTGKKILIVTHGGVLDCLLRKTFHYSLSSGRNFSIYNTAINKFSVCNDEWKLEEWGNIDHLMKIEGARDEL